MDSKPAVFREIAATLKSAILKGNFQDGTPFPTEHELSARFQVTRTTVRRALELLVQEGLVIKGQGRRIQVTLKPLTRTSWNFSSFSEGMRAMNDVPSSRVDAAECLDTPEGPVFHLVRTRGIVRGRDVQYLTREDSTVPLSIFPGIYEHDFAAESLYEVMRRDYGIFYYRIPGGEAGTDVYDRINDLLGSLYRDFEETSYPDNCVMITHGLTIRLFLMRFFHLTVEQFEQMMSPVNCALVVLELHDDAYRLATRMEYSDEPLRYSRPIRLE